MVGGVLSPRAEWCPRRPSPPPSSARETEDEFGRRQEEEEARSEAGSGWVRVFPDAVVGAEAPWDDEAEEQPGTLVHLAPEATAADLCRALHLRPHYHAIWVQYGGGTSRRLASDERPLRLQDAFLTRLGYGEGTRRARLSIDPELRHLIRFHVGPSVPTAALDGVTRCGWAHVLLGHVVPQWKERPVAILGSTLFVFQAEGGGGAQTLDLRGGHVVGGVSRGGRSVLRLAPAQHSEQRPMFLGFEDTKDRRVWWRWIAQATEEATQQWPEPPEGGSRLLDLSRGHLDGRLPSARILLQATTRQQEEEGPKAIDLSENRLGAAGGRGRADGGPQEGLPAEQEELRVLLSGVRSLRLSGNGLAALPGALLRLLRAPPSSPPPRPRRRRPAVRGQGVAYGVLPLQRLDLSHNRLHQLPQEIANLRALQWLSAEDNALSAMPSALPRRLRCLLLGKNRIRSLGAAAAKLTDHDGGQSREEGEGVGGEKRRCWNQDDDSHSQHQQQQLLPSLLEKIDLRNNLLDGDVVLGNYENLRELDLSDNDIERLDVRALRHLSVVQCARNSLVHLSLPGHKLTTLIASQNRLVSLTVEPTPLHLEHLHVSRNELLSLPDWPWERFRQLNFLDASHNHLQMLPHRLHVAPNLTELHLHANEIRSLHEGFLSSPSLQVINLSNNRLTGGLPPLVLGSDGLLPWSSPLLSLRLTGNDLTDAIWEALSELTALTLLHLAYNALTTVPEKCVEMWTDMEELVLSGNTLSFLPDSIGQLQKLRTLRAHSNKLKHPPRGLSKLNNLRVLDLSHNQLEHVDLGDLVPTRLSFLDLSGNPRLHVDPSQFNSYRSQRKMSLVDVSGNNRTSLPSTPYHEAGESYETILEGCEGQSHVAPPWSVGFSETPGDLERLHTTQIRLPAFCNTEGLFGLFDGGSVGGGAEAAALLATLTPTILLEERTVKETANDYMKYTILSAHRELKDKGQKFGACAILCHITAKSQTPCTSKAGGNNNGDAQHQAEYILRVASVGQVGAILCHKDGTLFPLTTPNCNLDADYDLQEESSRETMEEECNAIGLSSSFPQVVPDPHIVEIDLSAEKDACIIIANKTFWSSVQQTEAACEILRMLKPSLDGEHGIDEMIAAKRLQDLAQSYGNAGNLSIAVVHLFAPQGSRSSDKELPHDALRKSLQMIQRNGTTDLLMKELKQELRAHHSCHCCCHCAWAQDKDKCLPHLCHRRWCAVEGRALENGIKSSSVSDHLKEHCGSRGDSVENSINETASGREAQFQECCEDKGVVDETPSKHLPERSSPSGQSDDVLIGLVKDKSGAEVTQDNSDSAFGMAKEKSWGERSKLRRIPGAWDVCVGGESVLMREKGLHKVSAMPALVTSSADEGGEERFKCWEYMLEQNTQLLFDKELDTISRGVVRGRGPWASEGPPQYRPPPPAPFLSRRFSSVRGKGPSVVGAPKWGGSGRGRAPPEIAPIQGGPNAAYFGSLQRLLPGHVGFDFEAVRETGSSELQGDNEGSWTEKDGGESVAGEAENRMQAYWGVATTEL
ncbi:protein phosphatase PHLPP-like protein [Ischnura elegans]|uniref:protein phosphatase PHLPP-like protein n=1 Tax=Ischnura elegans TaxID=197161 RepID=UPI001ED86FEE|nr:protein phosphatase PHLPP-like protein [Ischnura elegans]